MMLNPANYRLACDYPACDSWVTGPTVSDLYADAVEHGWQIVDSVKPDLHYCHKHTVPAGESR